MAEMHSPSELSQTSYNPDNSTAMREHPAPWLIFQAIFPLIAGLILSRVGLIVACYGSYKHTDEGVFTDGAMLVALAIMAVLFIAVLLFKKRPTKRQIDGFMVVSIIGEVIPICALGLLDLADAGGFYLRFSLCVMCTFFSSFCMFYWLRCAVNAHASISAVLVFSALGISEVLIYIFQFLPIYLANLIVCVLVLLQFPCIRQARKKPQPSAIGSRERGTNYYGFSQNSVYNARFLITTSLGIGMLSTVVGLLRGFPDGLSIPFTLATRTGYTVMVCLICLWFIWFMVTGHRETMTVGAFITMELLASLALIFYAAFPNSLDIGAMFATVLNAFMVAFTWYIVIAFMSVGWRDPYYYAMAGWFVWLGARALARMALLVIYEFSASDMLVNVLMGTLVLVSTQVVFVQFLNTLQASKRHAVEAMAERSAIDESLIGESPHRPSLSVDAMSPSADQSVGMCAHGDHPCSHAMQTAMADAPSPSVMRIMGLNNEENQANMRQTSMRHSAEIVGEQFKLSAREVDVLALYALGYTQKRVAEELYISQSTAHAHIKRIYAKTDMHSRQEVLDYIAEYAS